MMNNQQALVDVVNQGGFIVNSVIHRHVNAAGLHGYDIVETAKLADGKLTLK